MLRLHYFQDSPDNTETNKTLAKIIEATLENTDGLIYKILSRTANQVERIISIVTPVVVPAGAGHQEARVPPGLVPGEPAHGGGRVSLDQLPVGEPGRAQQVSPGRQLPPQPQPGLGLRPTTTQVAPRHFGWGEFYSYSSALPLHHWVS